LDWAVGKGFSEETGFRGKTSKRGMGWVKGWTPNNGLGVAPVGMLSPYALPTKGFRPRMGANRLPAVKRPHLKSSRRETWPWDRALTISARFLRAFSASLSRTFDAFKGR